MNWKVPLKRLLEEAGDILKTIAGKLQEKVQDVLKSTS
jgi:hypothetical protein